MPYCRAGLRGPEGGIIQNTQTLGTPGEYYSINVFSSWWGLWKSTPMPSFQQQWNQPGFVALNYSEGADVLKIKL